MINCIIVDDEPLARQLISVYIKKTPEFNLVGSYQSASEAFTAIHQHPIDVIFLDIQMPGVTGIDFVKSLKLVPKVVFITAHSEFAVEAFELDAIDYLVKPVAMERFMKAAQKIIGSKSRDLYSASPQEPTSIFLKVDRRLINIDLNLILYIEALGDYLKVHLRDKTYVSYMTLARLETLLPKSKFIRVHRSTIINITLIEYIEGNTLVINGIKITIGLTYKDELLKKMS